MNAKLLFLALQLGLAAVMAQPVITHQPVSQTNIAGATVTFSVGATGTPPLSYQWVFNNLGNKLPGATNDILILPNVQSSNAGIYRVTVTNATGSVLSGSARLTVVSPPSIEAEPSNQNTVAGESATISVVASGTVQLSYQWYFNSQPRSGATSSNLVFASVQFSNAGSYSLVITNLYGAATSRVATVRVVPPTLFTKISSGPIATDLGQSAGSAWADFDNDGFLDLYNAQYWSPTNFFYHNNRDGTFTRIAQGEVLVTSGYNFGASAADYDNDGWMDLIVTTAGVSPIPRPVVLFHNNGDATFTRVSGGGMTNQVGYFPVAQWADYDNDGFIDLLITQTDITESGASTNLLWHNNGDGDFSRVTANPMLIDRMAAWNFLWSDYDNDGLLDGIAPSASDGRIYVFHNLGQGAFEKLSESVVVTDIYSRSPPLRADFGDYDNDGWQDLFVLDAGGGRNHLYHNAAGAAFFNVTFGPMLTPPAGSGGRSCGWGDYDNDGYIDLFVVYRDRILLYRNNHDGTFTEIRSIAPALERLSDFNSFFGGVTSVDFDNDGFLDLHVGVGNLVNPYVSNFLYHNAGNTNSWLEVKCVGTVVNRAAIGAKIRVKANISGNVVWQLRELRSGGSTPLVAHFGLGDATDVDTLCIEWPSGTVQKFHNAATKQILTITEPPRLTAIRVGGQPQFTIKGGRNMTYDIQSSANLVDWSPGSLVTITNFNGTVPIPIAMPHDGPQKFYRAVLR